MSIRSIVLITICLAGRSFAQPSTSDCAGAIQLCGGVYTETDAPPGTGNVYEFTGTCNASLETSSLWYTFTVQEDGNISFILDPAQDVDDYDWGLFNITEGGCAGINAQDGSSPEVNCNSYGSIITNGPTGISSANGGTGTSNGPGDLNGPAFNADLPVEAGQTFALVVMNWSGSPDGYSIDFTQSTADLYDSTTPEVSVAEVTCNNQDFHVEFSEPVMTATVQIEDFSLTTPSGDVLTFSTFAADQPGALSQTDFTLGMDPGLPAPGTYVLNITALADNVEDICGNIVEDTSFEVIVPMPLTFTATATTACNGVNGSVDLAFVGGGVEPITFTLGGTEVQQGTTTGLDAGTYTLMVSDVNGCASEAELTIPDHILDVTIAEVQDSISCANLVVTIQGVSVQPEQEVAYTWTVLTANGTDSTFSTSPTPSVTEAGFYTLNVSEPVHGCTDEASIAIFRTVAPLVDLGEIVLPNVVSPNADGKNDVWRPYVLSDPARDISGLFSKFELTIMDRWGQVAFESAGSTRLWTAREVVDGTYFYTMSYRAECGAVYDAERTGTITVLR